ncbi:MAG: tRNA pseudouridine(38-40) synthase TruA [Clostridia bacterium]|nr:tRNA pseudouridine(38-40) synthase TruA [Clostridia bacterium]
MKQTEENREKIEEIKRRQEERGRELGLRGIKLTISYDGTNYAGWQVQDNARTIQGELEKVNKKIFGEDVRITASGRTDAGVHANGQVAMMQVKTNINIENLPLIYNTKLPKDIVVLKAEEVPVSFHPIEDVTSKVYEYKILNSDFRNVRLRNYTYFVPRKLNVEAMKEAAKYFVGEHDFVGFAQAGIVATDTVREIFSLDVNKDEEEIITIRVEGKGFLHNMVRIITGTLIYVGQGTIDPKDIPGIIESKDRSKAGFTAPAYGLTMCEVHYEKREK